MRAAAKLKRLQRSTFDDPRVQEWPHHILSYVVAFAGPARMQTVLRWLLDSYTDQGLQEPSMTRLPVLQRLGPSLALDGIFVLGRGFLFYADAPLTLQPPKSATELYDPTICWEMAETTDNNLLYLFLPLTLAVIRSTSRVMYPTPYVEGFQVPNYQVWREGEYPKR